MKTLKKLAFWIIALCALSISVNAQDAHEIIKKADEKFKGKTSISEMTIKIIRPTWTRELHMKSWSKGSKFSLTLITFPAKEKGIVFLKRDKEIWNWVPSIERNIKLPPSMMMQSWMGSDFTNDDLVKESSTVTDYVQKIVGDSVIIGRICWKLELIPKPDAPVVWGKIYTWIDQKDYLQLRAEFYDEDGYLVNIMQSYDIKMLGGKLLPAKMEMIPVEKEGHKTVMEFKSMIFDKPMEDSFFTTQNMKRVR